MGGHSLVTLRNNSEMRVKPQVFLRFGFRKKDRTRHLWYSNENYENYVTQN